MRAPRFGAACRPRPAAFFLLRKHWGHVGGYWPYLPLLACPVMHLFHGHGGHGRHGGHGAGPSRSPNRDE